MFETGSRRSRARRRGPRGFLRRRLRQVAALWIKGNRFIDRYFSISLSWRFYLTCALFGSAVGIGSAVVTMVYELVRYGTVLGGSL